MATGKVKWFNNAKGYGFILADESEEDLFAHFSSIQMDGYKTLKAGQSVGYDLVEGPKGNHAVNIREADQASSNADQTPMQSMDEPLTGTETGTETEKETETGDDALDISEDSAADSIGNH